MALLARAYVFVVLVLIIDCCILLCFFFFFKQKTAYEMRISDWSSDVCSSDLLIAAVFLLDGADTLATPGFAEVDVEIGHRYAFGVQEAFEQQPELQGIEIGDRERPGDHRARARAAPRPHRNIVILRPFDEIGDDQEIAGKAHLDDDPDFEVEPREIGLALRLGERLARKRLDLGEPHLEPGARIKSEEHTSELQSLMRISYAVFCLKTKT